jgi:hypothetical protein
MPLGSRGWRAGLPVMAVAWAVALLPGVARATYTGVQDATTLGTVAVGGGWMAVPQYEESSDPGTIDGTPSDNRMSSLEVARVAGSRSISFRPVGARYSVTMGRMLVAGAEKVLAVAWTDTAGGGEIESARLNASGHLPTPVTRLGAPQGNSLALTAGPDGAYALWWREGGGTQAVAAPAGSQQQQLSALLGAGVLLSAADEVVLAGGELLWLVSEEGGLLSAAPAAFGQSGTPRAVPLGEAAQVRALGDGAGGLWVLARGGGGWLLAHVDRMGSETSRRLPADTRNAVMALAGRSAVVAYSSGGGRCASYIERLGPTAAPEASGAPRLLTKEAGGCWTARGIAVDGASGTAYVVMRSAHGMKLTTEARGGRTSSWRGSLGGQLDAIVAAGANRVVIETHGRQHEIGEQCGGAGPSSSQPYYLRVFHGARLERTGKLDASVLNC